MNPSRLILHVDMDAFFASIEQIDDPACLNQPVLVGSDRPRGVVAAASYEARQFGCRSAQPMAVAKRLCPHALIRPPRGRRYSEVSARLFELFQQFTPLVEPLSIDEAFLDVTGCERLFGDGPAIANQIKKTVRDQLHLTASVGVASNKFLAKLASDLDKPDGLTLVDTAFLQDRFPTLSLRKLWGVGPKAAEKLEKIGLKTIGDIARCDVEHLRPVVGQDAERLHLLSHGVDDRPLTTDRQAKSFGSEHTIEQDVEDPEEVLRVLHGQADQTAWRLRQQQQKARTVILKIRFGDFQTITRSRTLDHPTDQTDLIWSAAKNLFTQWSHDRFSPVRLIGVTATSLVDGDGQLGLFEQDGHQKRQNIDAASDQIRRRFGARSIRRGQSLDP